MVKKLCVQQKILIEAERVEVEKMYRNGMTMTAIARFYGCHYTTVGRILRRRNVPIRETGAEKYSHLYFLRESIPLLYPLKNDDLIFRKPVVGQCRVLDRINIFRISHNRQTILGSRTGNIKKACSSCDTSIFTFSLIL